MNGQEIKQVEQRVRRYWYSDGIAELASGGMFLLLGTYFFVLEYFQEGSLVSVLLQAGMLLFFVGGAFGVRWLVNTLKSRMTYPRTGYVEYRAKDGDSRKRRLIIVFTAFAVAALAVVLSDYVRALESMVLITGVIAGVVFIALRGRSAGLKRFYLLGGLSVFLGIGLAFSGLPQVFTLSIFYGFMGVAILISGALVLRRYLTDLLPSRRGKMAEDLRGLTGLDRLIHEPARLLIVTILSTVESADFLFLQRETDLTRGNLSAHLSKLEESGYVEIEKTYKGKLPLTVCKLTSSGQAAFERYRRQMQAFISKTGD